ncbi:MAG TPA: GFA family protein [Gammaproteobacteria bacterium]|nr:GFA family protein [Gammaproteobacteria bacterium]
MVNCHCRDCQRAGGAGHSPTVVIPRSQLLIRAGEPKLYERRSERGSTATRAFCGECGSPLFAWSSARPEMVGIRAGSLDDPSWFKARADVWTQSAQAWDILAPDTKKHERGP